MDELIRKYTIKEIAKKTHISPVVLNHLINRRFEKIPKLKFKGFLQILKNEYPNISFFHLEAEGNEFYSSNGEEEEKGECTAQIETNNKIKSYIFVIILIAIIGWLIYYMLHIQGNKVVDNRNITKEELKIPEIIVEENQTHNKTVETTEEVKREEKIVEVEQKIEQKIEQNIEEKIEENKTEENKTEQNNTILISPQQKVRFRVYFLDNNSTEEYLTSNKVELNGSGNLFIKFGNGFFKLYYHNRVTFPNTKKIVRIILKDGELNITKKRLSEFK